MQLQHYNFRVVLHRNVISGFFAEECDFAKNCNFRMVSPESLKNLAYSKSGQKLAHGHFLHSLLTLARQSQHKSLLELTCILTSANAFNLDPPKSLSLGKEVSL